MLFGLYFTACISGTPLGSIDCVDRVVYDEAVSTPLHCTVVAQPMLAKWADSHRAYRITSWRCGSPPRPRGTRA